MATFRERQAVHPRQIQVFRLHLAGVSTMEIAKRLGAHVEAVREDLELMQREWETAGKMVASDFHQDPAAEEDHGRLSQLFERAIGGSVRASRGGRRLRRAAGREDESGELLAQAPGGAEERRAIRFEGSGQPSAISSRQRRSGQS